MGKNRRQPGQIRIVGGEFRGRRIPVPDKPGLRPTPDRVRETLFNWLQPHLPGSRCLDLFAGTGALSLEASSRGARRVVALERDRELARHVRDLATAWHAAAVECVHADALVWLKGDPEQFDIVLLDPPFGAGLLDPALAVLAGGGWFADRALVYLERPVEAATDVPPWLEACRAGRAGQVAFGLYRWAG